MPCWSRSAAIPPPPQWFFHDLGDTETVKASTLPAEIDETDELARRETLTLIRAFNRIKDPEKRERLIELVQAVGEADHASWDGSDSQLPG